MSSLHPTLDIPKRISLSGQAAATMRKAIAEGAWTESLPSERHLCEMLQVSRPTVRTALHLLAKDGIIEIRHGRRNRLLNTPRSVPLRKSRLIVLVTPQLVSQVSFFAYEGFSEMRARLAEHGFTTEILEGVSGTPRVQRRKLEEFLRRNRVFCFVLTSVSKELQEWLFNKSVPSLVLGSCYPEASLASLDVDYRSVCRHAAGIFLSKGHRRLALVVPDSGVAGDLASEEGFREAVEQRTGKDDACATIVRHNGTALSISGRLDAVFDSDRPPTALLVAKPQFVFIVIIYLLKRGLSVPETVSLISRDHDHVFASVSPPITHYRMERDIYGNRLSRLMLKMVSQGYLTAGPNLISPQFIAGGTVKALR